MKTLSNLKKDLEFNSSLSSLIEVLKTIAVSQFRALEQRIKSFEKLQLTIETFFELIDIARVDHIFLNPGNKPQGVVAVTSDSGLLGGLNMQVVNQALVELEKTPGKLIVIGERGKAYLRDTRIPFVSFGGIRDEQRYGQAVQMRDYIVSQIFEGSFASLKVVYPRPISFTVQRVEVCTFLPFGPSAVKQPEASTAYIDVILESRIQDIIEYLIYIWMGQKFYEIFGLSRLAEFAARFVHLEASHQKLREMDKKIRLEYFRVRHELIDRNMRELFAARLLYAS
jgi:ATP synthase F1 gamma subunit